ncbi:Uncharacterised protein [uncultured archaeon]|nr:Uncharacterised protein [uncultured archaeon]
MIFPVIPDPEEESVSELEASVLSCEVCDSGSELT